MTYDPFARGRYPVGVQTAETCDASRQDRPLPIEIWYPATDAHAGRDVDDPSRDRFVIVPGLPAVRQDAVRDAEARAGSYPLVVFSHGFGGHRRQTTFLCTHLASHGYVVAAVDHTGNTMIDIVNAVMAVHNGGMPLDPIETLTEFLDTRPADVQFVIDVLLSGAPERVARLIDPQRIGMSGHSFGGWTTMAVTARDRRIRAALPLAPAGGATHVPTNPLEESLDFSWGRDVPTLFLVAERDSLLPLPGMHDLLAKTRATKKMVVLTNADHMHFCDRVEQVHEMFRLMPPPGELARIAKTVPPITELCPASHAYLCVNGLGLAHMDATLKENDAAARFMAADLERTLADHGVGVEVF